MSYAVIETGGKQYRVEPGEVIDVELLPPTGDGGSVEFDRVLLVADEGGLQVGSPSVEGARVRGTVLSEVRGPKIRVFKMKRRKQYRRTRGHRQDLCRVRIDEIAV
jgi:large subunit ribosomal protein L21